ncbi:MAG TPA: hypothetical protein VFA10_13825, partial [Ktedonobacteraceae bacterium]|nr:hypothetical protein [Ktedonobacteraceae bacterium]
RPQWLLPLARLALARRSEALPLKPVWRVPFEVGSTITLTLTSMLWYTIYSFWNSLSYPTV